MNYKKKSDKKAIDIDYEIWSMLDNINKKDKKSIKYWAEFAINELYERFKQAGDEWPEITKKENKRCIK